MGDQKGFEGVLGSFRKVDQGGFRFKAFQSVSLEVLSMFHRRFQRIPLSLEMPWKCFGGFQHTLEGFRSVSGGFYSLFLISFREVSRGVSRRHGRFQRGFTVLQESCIQGVFRGVSSHLPDVNPPNFTDFQVRFPLEFQKASLGYI